MMLVTLLAWAFVLLLLPIVAVAYLMDKRFDVRENTSPSEGGADKETSRLPRPRKIRVYRHDRSEY